MIFNYYVASFTVPYENLKNEEVFKSFINRKFYSLTLLNLFIKIKMIGLARLKQHVVITKYNYHGAVIKQNDKTSNIKNTGYIDQKLKIAIHQG